VSKCRNCGAVIGISNNPDITSSFAICINCGTDNLIFHKKEWVSITTTKGEEATIKEAKNEQHD
jgi:hypothetical protein